MYSFKDSLETKCVPPVPDLLSQIKKDQPKMYTLERYKINVCQHDAGKLRHGACPWISKLARQAL